MRSYLGIRVFTDGTTVRDELLGDGDRELIPGLRVVLTPLFVGCESAGRLWRGLNEDDDTGAGC